MFELGFIIFGDRLVEKDDDFVSIIAGDSEILGVRVVGAIVFSIMQLVIWQVEGGEGCKTGLSFISVGLG